MPQIAEYNAAVENIHPSETGEVALARAGTTIRAESRMTAGEYQQAFQDVGGSLKKVGELMDAHDSLHEISTGAALGATNYNNAAKKWDDQMKDPATAADPQAGQKFLDSMQPQWEKFQAGFLTPQGKKWAADYVERAQEHLGEKITRDQSTLAGIHVQNMVKTWGNQSTLAIATDPSSMNFHLGEIGPTVDAMLKNSPMLSAEDNARVREGMTRELKETFQKTAMQSIARLDPGRAEGMLKAGAFPDVNGAEATATIASERRNLKVEAEVNRAAADRADRKNSERIEADFAHQMADAGDDPTKLQGLRTAVLRAAGEHGLNPGVAIALSRSLETQVRETEAGKLTPNDATTQKSLTDAILNYDPYDANAVTYRDILAAHADGKLNTATRDQDIRDLNLMITNPQLRGDMKNLDDFQKRYGRYIDNSVGGTVNPLTSQRLSEFQQFTKEMFQKADPATRMHMLKPGDPAFLGQYIHNFQLTPAESLNGFLPHVPVLPPAVVMEQQKEEKKSPEDFLKKPTPPAPVAPGTTGALRGRAASEAHLKQLQEDAERRAHPEPVNPQPFHIPFRPEGGL